MRGRPKKPTPREATCSVVILVALLFVVRLRRRDSIAVSHVDDVTTVLVRAGDDGLVVVVAVRQSFACSHVSLLEANFGTTIGAVCFESLITTNDFGHQNSLLVVVSLPTLSSNTKCVNDQSFAAATRTASLQLRNACGVSASCWAVS